MSSNGRKESLSAGIFILVAGFVFVLFLVAVLGKTWFQQDRIYYTTFTHSVQGLEKGSPVKYLGVPAGSVADIRFVRGNFPKIQVTMNINDFVPIKEGTKATLAHAALTGLAHIELVGGENSEQEIDEGAQIPVEASFYQKIYNTIPAILEALPSALLEIERAAKNLGALMGQENRESFQRSLASLEKTIESFDQSFKQTTEVVQKEIGQLSSTVRNEISATTQELRELASGTLRKEIESAGNDLRGFLKTANQEVEQTLQSLRTLVAGEDVKKIVQELGNFSKRLDEMSQRIDSTMRNLESSLVTDQRVLAEALFHLRRALHDVGELVDRLRHDPSAILFSSPPLEREIPEPAED